MRSFLESSFDYCRWLTRRSGSHFALSFYLLPAPRRQGMEIIYAFCRAMDDIVDTEGILPEQALRQLNDWRRELKAMEAGFPAHPITVALAEVQRSFGVPTAHFETMIDGMQMDLTYRRYPVFEELRSYCEKVASSVGWMSIKIFGCRNPASERYATALGIALQLTNILRDIKTDAAVGRVYLPQDDLKRFCVSEQDILEGRMMPALKQLLIFETARAEDYFKQAADHCRESGEGRKLLPAQIMSKIYRRLLEKIQQSDYAVFGPKISVPKTEQIRIALRCLIAS